VCNQIAEREWAIDGTPADCVIVALHNFAGKAGHGDFRINHGANLGENVYYSGTVGAAREGALHHIPSDGDLSLCSKKENTKFENSARVARAAAELILKKGLPDQVLLNVNVPEPWNGSVKFTGNRRRSRATTQRRKDPRGRSYFWLFEQRIDKDVEPDTDYAAIFFAGPSPSLRCTRPHARGIAQSISRTGPSRSSRGFSALVRGGCREAIPRRRRASRFFARSWCR